MNTEQRRRVRLLPLLLLCAMVLALVLPGGFSPGYAHAASYTGVIADLSADSAFDVADYPDNPDDTAPQVLRVAESENGSLLIYVYLPCQRTRFLPATKVNMALGETASGTKLYGLTLLNNDGVFAKYKVNDFTASVESVRYYNISAIYRAWNAEADGENDPANETNDRAFEVGKLFRAETAQDGSTTYSFMYKDVVNILNPFADYLTYSEGFNLYLGSCHSHYVAFSTDKQIDKLMEADVSYITQTATRTITLLNDKTRYGDPVEQMAYLAGEDKGGNEANGWFAKKYEWNRIQSVAEFMSSEDLKDETKKQLAGKQWVLRFTETAVTQLSSGSTIITDWTKVSEVAILRLKFITNGVEYDLGAVGDIVTGDDEPGNNNTNEYASLWAWLERLTGVPASVWKMLAVAIPALILLAVLAGIFPVVAQVLLIVLKGLGTVLLWLFKGLVWLIALPFKGIALLFDKKKKEG